MACIRKRRGKWVVDYRDATGARRWITRATKKEAEDAIATAIPASREVQRPLVDANITVREYADRWRRLVEGMVQGKTLKPATLGTYDKKLKHILPALGAIQLRQLHKGRIKMFLAEKLRDGLSKATVRLINATLGAMLTAAMDDEVIKANPAWKQGKHLHLSVNKAARQEEIKAFTREQLRRFLTAALEEVPRHYVLFLLLARTGLRVNEALALKWDCVDFGAREIRVALNLSNGTFLEPKSGHGRTVDMSQQLLRALFELEGKRRDEAARCKLAECPPWVFHTDRGMPLCDDTVRRAMKATLKAAKLPAHYTPHCLRHTFASILLQDGASPAYVQRQLGHASIQLTVDTYGKWLPMGNKAVVDRLDDPLEVSASANGSNVVAELTSDSLVRQESVDIAGTPDGAHRALRGNAGFPRATRYAAPLTHRHAFHGAPWLGWPCSGRV